MVYIISTPKGDKIQVQFDESKPVSKIKVMLITSDKEEIAKSVSFKKEV